MSIFSLSRGSEVGVNDPSTEVSMNWKISVVIGNGSEVLKNPILDSLGDNAR